LTFEGRRLLIYGMGIYLILYNAFFLLVLAAALPFIWRDIRPDRKFPGKWKERFAIYDDATCEKLWKQKNIWFHTVSIGEFLSVTPLIDRLQKQGNENIVVTLSTKTGQRVAEKKIPSITRLFFPLDFYPVMRRAIRKINPKLIVIIETELWPNLLRIAGEQGIPVLLLNGRISPSSFPGYRKIRFFTRKFLPLFTAVTMRTQEEAERLIYLGAARENVRVSGSMKFDLACETGRNFNPQQVREKLGIGQDRRIVVFGSVSPREEEQVAETVQKILKEFSDVVAVIVPRYLDMTNIYKILKQRMVNYVRYTGFPWKREYSVIVVDAYGELNNFYSICEFAFVGGSLCSWGGQNPIEPIAFRKPVLFGIHNWQFKEEWDRIKDGGGGIEVESFGRLHREMIRLLRNPEICRQMGENGYKVLLENTGATERNLQVISRFLQPADHS